MLLRKFRESTSGLVGGQSQALRMKKLMQETRLGDVSTQPCKGKTTSSFLGKEVPSAPIWRCCTAHAIG